MGLFFFFYYFVLIGTDISHVLIYTPDGGCGLTDHISIMMVFASSCALKSRKPTQKTITVWPTEAEAMLQGCFEITDWQMFRETTTTDGNVDLEEYTSAVTRYNRK